MVLPNYNETRFSIKVMIFHSKMAEAEIAATLYTSLRWLFSLKVKSV